MEVYIVSFIKFSRFRNNLIFYFIGGERMIDFGKFYRYLKIGFYVSSIFNFDLIFFLKLRDIEKEKKIMYFRKFSNVCFFVNILLLFIYIYEKRCYK